MCGIYEATRMAHMVYSGTKGLPQSLEDVSTNSQHNRLPREVITGNTGLCLELSLLYASVMSAAGIDPIIYLIPGHAYPGFRMQGQYYAIEATGIGGEGLGGINSVEKAFQTGQKELEEFIQKAQMGDPRYSIVDVHALNAMGVTPMALKDDEFLRKKVDEIAANFGAGSMPSGNQPQYAQGGGGGGQASGGASGSASGGRRTSGPLSFALPGGWSARNRPYPSVPIVTLEAVSGDMTTNAIVYDVQAGNVNDAMSVIAGYLASMGSEVHYNNNGNYLEGQTYSMNGTYVWKGRAKRTGSGMRIVAVGTYDYLFGQKSGEINALFNSIQ